MHVRTPGVLIQGQEIRTGLQAITRVRVLQAEVTIHVRVLQAEALIQGPVLLQTKAHTQGPVLLRVAVPTAGQVVRAEAVALIAGPAAVRAEAAALTADPAQVVRGALTAEVPVEAEAQALAQEVVQAAALQDDKFWTL